MPYVVEIIADDSRTDWQLMEEKEPAQNRYFCAFAAVIQNAPVRAEDGTFVRLIGCFLYEVPTNEMSLAQAMIQKNQARRLQSSDDYMCGELFGPEGLLKKIN